ncbi:MAG: ATP-dependent helicase HrpB [Bdellovibrio sp.]
MSHLIPLPIDEFIPSILDKMKREKNLVITAAPGAGKTTRLPPALLTITSKKIIVLEPRRMAAIAAAHRIAEEQGWEVGKDVGYKVRFMNKTSANTRLLFMTEALLARQLLEDPELNDVGLVLLDEFHERSLHVDLALGLLRELQDLGAEIKIVVMSATLEAEKISSYLGNSSVVSVPGKLHEMEILYQKGSQLLQTSPAFFENLTQTVKEAQRHTTRDILVFLPGVGEIDRAQNLLAEWAQERTIDLVPLHGSLKLEEQRKALQKGSRQRIILSTNIAESSVTLDGVDTVVDSGLAKSLRQDHRTGFARLELGRISLSNAIQRSGRSARQYPGRSYRLWNKMDELSFTKSDTPEIQRVDLTESLLFLSAQGVSQFEGFSWFEKPPQQALQSAARFLQITGAVDSQHHITPHGKKLLQFPLPVRLGQLMLKAVEWHSVKVGAELAALLQERDLLRRDSVAAFLGDQLECDLSARLMVLEEYRRTQRAPPDVSRHLLQTLEQSAQQIVDLCRSLVRGLPPQHDDPQLVKKLLLYAYSDRLCRRRASSDRALMTGGRGVRLHPDSLVKNSEFFVALNGVEGASDAETLVSLACGFDKNLILETFQDKIIKTKEVSFSEEKGQFFLKEYKSLHGLPLEEPSLFPASSQDIADKLPLILREKFAWVLKENESLARWWQRLEFFFHHDTSETQNKWNWEELKLEAFTRACMGESNIHVVTTKDLVFFFKSSFPTELVATLDKELPDKITVPSGSAISVYYPLDKAPYLEVRIQEVFGMMQTPRVFFQKMPLTFHLLGPNYRPVQVTSNLESFWQNGYPEVRKELRIKYPKHQWPEDPAEGKPEAKGRPRR